MQCEAEADAIRPFESRIRNPIVSVARARIRAAFLNKIHTVEAHRLGLE